MKIIGVIAFLFVSFELAAQWNYDSQNIIYSSNGNVGIGVTNPYTKLEVAGGGHFSGRLSQNGSIPNDNNAAFWNMSPTGYGLYSQGGGGGRYAFHLLNQEGSTILYGKGNGLIGIGTTDPKYPLTVKGALNAEANGDYYGAWLGGESRTDKPSINVGAWWNNKGSVYWNSNKMIFRVQLNDTDIFENNLVLTGGKVGIGTSNPTTELDVNGGITVQNNNNINWGGSFGPGIPAISATINSGIFFYPSGPTSGIAMRIHQSGNVGIGTTNPDQKLTVKGVIHTEEVRVDMTVPGPDYVFEPTYNLLPLSEVDSYIKANKHLPEVPSAKQMEEEGLNLKEMNLLLLKKVEELTLHLIEKEKEIGALKMRMETVEQKIR